MRLFPAFAVCVFAVVGIEYDNVVVEVEVKLRTVVARDAERVHAVALAQFFDVQAGVAPVGRKYRDLLIAQFTNARGQLLHCTFKVVGRNDWVHALGTSRWKLLRRAAIGSEDALWVRILVEGF